MLLGLVAVFFFPLGFFCGVLACIDSIPHPRADSIAPLRGSEVHGGVAPHRGALRVRGLSGWLLVPGFSEDGSEPIG